MIPSREELFSLVWQRPLREVAAGLHITTAQLIQRCQDEQIPRPPRGYWVSGAAKQRALRWSLPPINEVLAASYVGLKAPKERSEHTYIRLTSKQQELVQKALNELEKGSACGDLIDTKGRLKVTPELAARLLILIQCRLARWLSASKDWHPQGMLSTAGQIVEKLLLVAQDQVLILRRQVDKPMVGQEAQSLVMRLSPGLYQRILELYRLVIENDLASATCDLSRIEYAPSLRAVKGPSQLLNPNHGQVHVSSHHVWITCALHHLSYDQKVPFQSTPIPLRDLVPKGLRGLREVSMPSGLTTTMMAPYKQPLEMIRDVENVLDLFQGTLLQVEVNSRAALLERLLCAESETGVLATTEQATYTLSEKIDQWSERLEHEKSRLCQRILGLRLGDILVFQRQGKVVRMELTDASVSVWDGEVNFQLHGMRFRQDGLPGKRTDTLYLSAPEKNI